MKKRFIYRHTAFNFSEKLSYIYIYIYKSSIFLKKITDEAGNILAVEGVNENRKIYLQR